MRLEEVSLVSKTGKLGLGQGHGGVNRTDSTQILGLQILALAASSPCLSYKAGTVLELLTTTSVGQALLEDVAWCTCSPQTKLSGCYYPHTTDEKQTQRGPKSHSLVTVELMFHFMFYIDMPSIKENIK